MDIVVIVEDFEFMTGPMNRDFWTWRTERLLVKGLV